MTARSATEAVRARRRNPIRQEELVDLLIAYPRAFEVLTAIVAVDGAGERSGDRPR